MGINDAIMLIRRTPPTKYDHHEYGALCKVVDTQGNEEIYVQLSRDPENPLWEKK